MLSMKVTIAPLQMHRSQGFNEEFWRHGLVFNQGNEMNVTEYRVQERLRFITSRLLRKLYGNHSARRILKFLMWFAQKDQSNRSSDTSMC